MAKAFSSSNGKAIKSSANYYTYVTGDNKIRLIGGILPRYVYWIKGANNKNIPVECLAFSREEERFNNEEKDWVNTYYPDLKCSWSYLINCFDPSDNTVKVLTLKKRLLEAIMSAAEDLGDPTDLDTGWYINFKKVKTGPLAYNVEYQLQPLKCKPEPLTAEQKAIVADAKPIDEQFPRQTAAEQRKFLEKLSSSAENSDEELDAEVESEFDIS